MKHYLSIFTAVLISLSPLAMGQNASQKAEATAAVAVDGTIVQQKVTWKGVKGQAKTAPEIKLVKDAQGTAVTAVAVENGNYQGMSVSFAQPVDLNQVSDISFDFQQTIRKNQSGLAAIIIYYAGGKGLMGKFSFTKEPWSKCSVPLNLKDFTAIGRGNQPVKDKAVRIMITMYRNMNAKGESMTVRNLVFHPVTGK